MANVRLYARVSTDEQRKKDMSVPAQLDALNRFCIENKHNIVGVYADNGISAATIKKRKEFCRMLDDLQQNDIILFTKLDRMSRSLLDSNLLLMRFEPLNVGFKAILEEDIDVTTADGKFIFNLKVSLAQREREVTSERLKVSFNYKLNIGQPLGGKLPVGYKRIGKKAIVDDQYTEFIKNCFDTIEIEMNTYAATKALNKKWKLNHDRKYYTRLWKKECYIGMFRGHANIFPAIISKEQFDHVQGILKSRYNKSTRSSKVYIFTGLIKCPICGNKLGATSTNGNSGMPKYKLYRCTNVYKAQKTHCCYAEKKLEKKLLSIITPTLKEISSRLDVGEKEEVKSVDIIKSLKQKIARLQDLYVDGKIEKMVFDKKYNDLISTIREEEQNNNANILLQRKNKIDAIINDDITELYRTFSDEDKRKFWHSFIEEIIVNDYDDIKIILQ